MSPQRIWLRKVCQSAQKSDGADADRVYVVASFFSETDVRAFIPLPRRLNWTGFRNYYSGRALVRIISNCSAQDASAVYHALSALAEVKRNNFHADGVGSLRRDGTSEYEL